MDEWFNLDGSGINDIDLTDEYWGSLCTALNGAASGAIVNDNGSACLGVGDANLMNSASQSSPEEFFKMSMEVDHNRFFGQDFSQHSQNPIQSSSSLSLSQSLSSDGSEYSSQMISSSSSSKPSFSSNRLESSIKNSATTRKLVTPSLVQSYAHPKGHFIQVPALANDADMEITRAMMAVISSTSSTSSPSSTSVVSPFRQEEYHVAVQQEQEHANSQFGAFRSYNSAPAGEMMYEPKCSGGAGQKMIKSSLSMSSRMPSSYEASEQPPEPKPVNNQLYHMMSERKRREKLNDSFQTLRMVLPPGSKKDKTSVLVNATNYLKTLNSQISDLEQKNKNLEAYLPDDRSKDANNNGSDHGNAKVQIIKVSRATPEVQQINLRITVRVECDIVELVLHVLECLKWMKAISLVSVDACTYSPHMDLSARASIKLQIMDCDWDEALFQEAMTRAVNDVASSCTPLCSELSHPF